MLLKYFYDDRLAQASYMIGCPDAGTAMVIDASRNIEPYLQAAEQHELSITHVVDTHIRFILPCHRVRYHFWHIEEGSSDQPRLLTEAHTHSVHPVALVRSAEESFRCRCCFVSICVER